MISTHIIVAFTGKTGRACSPTLTVPSDEALMMW